MAALDVEFEAVSDADGRFAHLAQLLGLADADHARGKCEHLWMACTTRGETDLPQWLVERHLGPAGPAALVEVKLARWGRGRGDSKTRRLYICGAKKRCLWLRNNQKQSRKGGETRARNASRVAGKFASDGLVKVDQPEPAPSPSPSPSPSPEISDPDAHPPRAIQPSTEYPTRNGMGPAGEPESIEPPTELTEPTERPSAAIPAPIANAVERSSSITYREQGPLAPEYLAGMPPPPQQPPPPILPASVARENARRHVLVTGWQLAGEAFRELGQEGIEPKVRDPWAGLPAADSPPMRQALAIVGQLLVGDQPDVEAAIAAIRNRVEVAKAEGRAKSPPTRRWLTPMRIWDPISFAKASEISPDQVGRGDASRWRVGPPPSDRPKRFLSTSDDEPPLSPVAMPPRAAT